MGRSVLGVGEEGLRERNVGWVRRAVWSGPQGWVVGHARGHSVMLGRGGVPGSGVCARRLPSEGYVLVMVQGPIQWGCRWVRLPSMVVVRILTRWPGVKGKGRVLVEDWKRV